MIHIRPATEDDFPALLHVQQAVFGEHVNVYEVSGWTRETLDSLREDAKEKHIFLAKEEGVVVGSVRFWTVDRPDKRDRQNLPSMVLRAQDVLEDIVCHAASLCDSLGLVE